MEQIDILYKYPEIFTMVGKINSDENLDSILITEEELKGIYERETRLFGFYDLDSKLCKIQTLALDNSRLDSVDYYFSVDKLIYVVESSNLFTKNLEVVKEESRYSKFIFKDNIIFDFERVGYGYSFDKVATEKILVADMTRNIGMLTTRLNGESINRT